LSHPFPAAAPCVERRQILPPPRIAAIVERRVEFAVGSEPQRRRRCRRRRHRVEQHRRITERASGFAEARQREGRFAERDGAA